MQELLKKLEKYWIPEVIIVIIILLLLSYFTFGNPFEDEAKKTAKSLIVPAEKAAGLGEDATTTTAAAIKPDPNATTTTVSLPVGEVRLKESSSREVAPSSASLVGKVGSKGKAWTYMGLKNFTVFGAVQGTGTSLFALSFKYGVYKLTGSKYVRTSKGISENSNNMTIAMSKSSQSRMYLGTKLTGVLKTVNGGDSWSKADMNGTDVKNLSISPTDPLTAYAGSETGLYKTTNGGTSWKRISPDDYPVSAVTVDPGNASTVYYSSYSDTGVTFKSINGGSTWQVFGPKTYTWQIAVSPQDSNNVFLGTDGGFYWTQDGGLNFNYVTIGSNSRINNIAVSPADPQIIYASTIGTSGGWDTNGNVFKSSDGGYTWKPMNTGLPATYVRQLFISPNNSKLIYGVFDDNGLYYFLDN